MDPRRPAQLTAPAERSSVRLARLVAAGVGAEAGLSIDDTEDLRIAVSELVALLVEGADDPRQSIVLTYRARPGEVTVDGERESATAGDERAGNALLHSRSVRPGLVAGWPDRQGPGKGESP